MERTFCCGLQSTDPAVRKKASGVWVGLGEWGRMHLLHVEHTPTRHLHTLCCRSSSASMPIGCPPTCLTGCATSSRRVCVLVLAFHCQYYVFCYVLALLLCLTGCATSSRRVSVLHLFVPVPAPGHMPDLGVEPVQASSEGGWLVGGSLRWAPRWTASVWTGLDRFIDLVFGPYVKIRNVAEKVNMALAHR